MIRSICAQCMRNYKRLHHVNLRDFTTSKWKNTPWNIVFFGTDTFSLESLKALHKQKSLIERLVVVCTVQTAKKMCAVERYAREQELPIHGWPLKAPLEGFDAGVVASFGHLLPAKLIATFPMGILNVHGSLLPRWRGAAPIAHAILAGDQVTGVTIMAIKPKRFDVGDILKQKECRILPDEGAVELTSRLAVLGAEALIDCFQDLPAAFRNKVPQPKDGVTKAPKLTQQMAFANWNKDCESVLRHWRALQGYLFLETSWNGRRVRIHALERVLSPPSSPKVCSAGHLEYIREEKRLLVRCSDGWLSVQRLAVRGKKIMDPLQFQNGFLSKVEEHQKRFEDISDLSES